MRRLILYLFLTIGTASASATTYLAYNGQCSKGGQQPVITGLAASGVIPTGGTPSAATGAVMGSFPLCTVTVFLHNSSTKPSLFSNESGTVLANPFTANSDGSFIFYIDSAIAGSFDIVLSGTVSPSFTLTDIVIGGSGGGGGGSGNATSIQGTSVSISSLTSGNLLEYNGSNWANFAPIWCPLAGCTMAGSITLPGNPTTTNMASNKGYVDTQVATKAPLISGLVPTANLGAGTANTTTFLRGDQTWSTAGGAGTGTCLNQAVTAVNAGSPTCTTINAAYVDSTAPTGIEVQAHKGNAGGYIGIANDSSVTMPGNASVGGTLTVVGSYFVQSASPSSPLAASALGTSSLGINSDGFLYVSPNSTGPFKVPCLSSATNIVSGHVWTADASGCAQDGGAAGAGNVSVSGSFTTNRLPKATAGTILADSLCSDDGTTFTCTDTGGISSAGNLTLTGATPTIASSAANANILFSPNGTGGVQIPVGSATNPTLVFTGGLTTGFSEATANKIVFSASGAGKSAFSSGGISFVSGGTLGWSTSSSDPTTGINTTLGYNGTAGSLSFGGGASTSPTNYILRGQAASGAADVTGGNFTVGPGVGTGKGAGTTPTGQFIIQGDTYSSTSGTTQHNNTTRHVFNASKTLTDNTFVTVVSTPLAADNVAGGTINYSVIADDTTGHANCVYTGSVTYTGENSAGVFVTNISTPALTSNSCTAGDSLTITWQVTGANPSLVQVKSVATGITATPAIYEITYEASSFGVGNPTY